MGKIHIVLIVFGILLLSALRFWNLGYSEYIPDETTVLTPIKRGQVFKNDFLAQQRKGPIQFLTAYGVSLLGVDVNNEFLYRLPFAFASIFALIFVYLAVLELSHKRTIALISCMLIGINGFILAFGRIVQYQSFNLLFSFAGLYFYSKVLRNNFPGKQILVNTFLGLMCLFLSFASHWDAVFFAPMFIYVFINFFKHHRANKTLIKSFLIMHFSFLLLVFLPFLFIFIKSYFSSQMHQSYFENRIGFVTLSAQMFNSKFAEFIDKDELYQPLYLLEFISLLAIVGLLNIKKSWSIFVWLLYCLFIFIFLVRKPGTHLYNIYIPLSVLAAHGFWIITVVFRKWLVIIPATLFVLALTFFVYQNYLLFIDYSVEYPWDQEMIYKTKTKKYDQISLSNNIIGFPLNRHWEDINKVILDDIDKSGGSPDQYSYITNEVKSVSAFYMDIPYGSSKNMYAIGIKRPFSFEQDYSFPQFHNRRTIAKMEYKGSMSARIYRIEQK